MSEDMVKLPESCVLDDKEIQYFGEYVPFAEGGGMDGFEEELDAVKAALARAGVRICQGKAGYLSLMRGMYFLGVMRGAEAYRDNLLDLKKEAWRPQMELELDPVCAERFEEDLRAMSKKDLSEILDKKI